MSVWKQLAVIAGLVVTPMAVAHGQGSPIADLMVASDVADQSNPGTDVSYHVTVTNNGPDAAVNAVVADPLPPGMTFVSATQTSGPAFLCSAPTVGGAGTVSCTLSSLANAASASFTFVFHIDASAAPGTFFTSVATVSTDTFDPNDENDAAAATTQTPPPPAADMLLTKAGPTGAGPNTDVVYTIDLTNGGPGVATDVSVDDPLPQGMTFVSLTQTSGPALSCSTPAVGTNGTITCTAASFPANATTELTLTGHIPPATSDGTFYQNSAVASSNFDPNSEDDATTTRLCVQANGCLAGPCNAFHAVVCPVPDQCHDQGTCNASTGVCAPNPPKSDGSPCNDGNACTLSDTCQAGVCTGATPVVCPVADQCHTQGICNPTTGACATNPVVGLGVSCDDGNACTQADSCQAGVCAGGNPVVCPVPDQCHNQGTCNPTSGTCAVGSIKANGTACSDDNACTQADSCQAGVCTGASPVVCPAADQCHDQGACNAFTGTCASNLPKSNGSSCNDANACTQGDTCQVGVCQGGLALNCDDGNACTADTCDIVAGCLHVVVCDGGISDASVRDVAADVRADVVGADAVRADVAPPVDAVVADVAHDAVSVDAGVDGAGALDVRSGDAQGDGATAVPSSDSGCDCDIAPGTSVHLPLAAVALVGLFFARRRRSRQSKRP